MHTFKGIGRRTALGAVGVVAALGIGGTAYAATGSSTGATSPTSGGTGAPANPPAQHPKRPRTLLQRADHATIEVKVKGQWVTYTVDRGKVSAVSPTSITLARPDGQSVTDTITSGTKFAGVSSEPAIQTGRPAVVVSDNGAALRIRQGLAPAPAPATS